MSRPAPLPHENILRTSQALAILARENLITRNEAREYLRDQHAMNLTTLDPDFGQLPEVVPDFAQAMLPVIEGEGPEAGLHIPEDELAGIAGHQAEEDDEGGDLDAPAPDEGDDH